MRRAALYLAGVTILGFLTVTGFAAQTQPGSRKLPKQTHDTGIDDDATIASGQASRAAGGRAVQSVKVTIRPNGTVVGQLDDSFEDALVVTRAPDGTWRYTCLHGLPAAEHIAATRQRPSVLTPEEK